jgi:hypothetical protein
VAGCAGEFTKHIRDFEFWSKPKGQVCVGLQAWQARRIEVSRVQNVPNGYELDRTGQPKWKSRKCF